MDLDFLNKGEIRVTSLNEAIIFFLCNADMFKINNDVSGRKLMYRGQPNSSFPICPSVFRNNALQKEAQMAVELKRIAPHEFASCSSQLECLIKMQHYGLPTRLLDVTFNPLVALYFACYDEKEQKSDGIVYAFPDYIYSHDDPNVERNAALSTYTGSSSKELKQHFNTKLRLEDSNKKPIISSLKKLFREKYYPFLPPLNNERIRRQQGGFFLFGLDVENQTNPFQKESFSLIPPSPLLSEDRLFHSIIVSAKYKQQILESLDAIGINHAFLFPELEHQAAYIKKQYSFSLEKDESDESTKNP